MWLRDFSWRYFTLTGDIDAYLLYRSHQEIVNDSEDANIDSEDRDTSLE